MDNSKFGLGAVRDLFDLRDYKAEIKSGFRWVFKDSFSLRMPPVKDQGSVSSCVAHALAVELEYFDRKETGYAHKFSTDYIYGNRRETSWKQNGMRMRDAIKTVKKYGCVSNKMMPGNTEVPEVIEEFERRADDIVPSGKANRIGRYFRLCSEEAIKACLIDYGPVVFSVDWYSDYRFDGDVLVFSDAKQLIGSHCMLIYGWCPTGWLVQNSWGKEWGYGGRAVLPYSIQLNEVWGVEDASNTVGDNWLDIRSPFASEFGKKVAAAVNAVLNRVFRRA